MSFESKKIIGSSLFWSHLGSWIKHLWLFIGMFLIWWVCTWWIIRSISYFSTTWLWTSLGLSTSNKNNLWTWSYSSTASSSRIINTLIVWVGWKWHRGAYNTDTLIIASYNPRTKQVNLISLPRDLYLSIDKWYYGRINSILDYYMTQKDHSLEQSLSILSQKVGNLIWQDIPYYAMIDFGWFEKLIDQLWWIQVEVPEELYDTSFPIDDFNYGTLHIDAGKQLMNGNTALNYARSRHSTSDFDRSRRQQIIIKSLMNKLFSFSSLTNIKSLYKTFGSMVITNVTLGDITQYARYIGRVNNINSVVFQSDCPENINQMKHGCILYSPPREQFGWAAVLLPLWATSTSISNYKRLFSFVHRIIGYPFGDFQHISLWVYNGIDKNSISWSIAGFASKLWVELVRNWAYVEYIWNNPIKHEQTMIVFWSWWLATKTKVAYTAFLEDILDSWPIRIIDSDEGLSFFSGGVDTWINTTLLIGTERGRTMK